MPPLHSVGMVPVSMAVLIASSKGNKRDLSASIHSSGGNLSPPAALRKRSAAMWCLSSLRETIPLSVSLVFMGMQRLPVRSSGRIGSWS